MKQIVIVVAEWDAQAMRDTISRMSESKGEYEMDMPPFEEKQGGGEAQFCYEDHEDDFYSYPDDMEALLKQSPCPAMIITGSIDGGDAYVKVGESMAWSRISGTPWPAEMVLGTRITGCCYDYEFESYLYLELYQEFQIYLSMQ